MGHSLQSVKSKRGIQVLTPIPNLPFLVTSLALPSYTITSSDSVPSDSDPGESDVEPLEIRV